jgi:class 3 adenylate cyclase
MDTHAIVLFADIRGFTRWSEGIEAFQYIDKFISDFYKILDEHFPGTYLKKLGDGAMIVKGIESSNSNYAPPHSNCRDRSLKFSLSKRIASHNRIKYNPNQLIFQSNSQN